MNIDGNWQIAAPRHSAAPSRFPLLSRFAGKLVLDILPAALASVIGGFLFTQYHLGRAAPPPPTEQIGSESTEGLALVREEHEASRGAPRGTSIRRHHHATNFGAMAPHPASPEASAILP